MLRAVFMENKALILFDGECNLCNGFVQFVLKRDPKGYFLFMSQQSPNAEKILLNYNIKSQLSSVVLIENDQAFKYSSAGLKILKKLTGFWSFFYVLIFFPKFLRDPFYHYIAKNRYKWFGKREQCMIPEQKWKIRFME